MAKRKISLFKVQQEYLKRVQQQHFGQEVEIPINVELWNFTQTLKVLESVTEYMNPHEFMVSLLDVLNNSEKLENFT